MDRLTSAYVWMAQTAIPVALRRTGPRTALRVKLPFAADNRPWLQDGRRNKPVWISPKPPQPGYWELPKTWFNDFVNRALIRYGRVYIIQPYNAHEVCAPACQNATGHECECSCMGQHHGAGNDGSWFEVSDTFAFRSGSRHLACRLLTARQSKG